MRLNSLEPRRSTELDRFQAFMVYFERGLTLIILWYATLLAWWDGWMDYYGEQVILILVTEMAFVLLMVNECNGITVLYCTLVPGSIENLIQQRNR